MTRNVRASAVAQQAPRFPREAAPTAAPAVTVNDGQLSLLQEIAESVERITVRIGLKAAVDFFDGRHGEPVAKSTLSRWGSEPTRCPAWAVPVLVELDPVFRANVIRLLVTRMTTDDELLAAVAERDPKAAQVMADVRAEIVQQSLFGDVHPKARRR